MGQRHPDKAPFHDRKAELDAIMPTLGRRMSVEKVTIRLMDCASTWVY